MGQKRIKTNMQTGDGNIGLAIHGGAGTIARSDQHGNISLPFNAAGMYRGHVNSTGPAVIEIYK